MNKQTKKELAVYLILTGIFLILIFLMIRDDSRFIDALCNLFNCWVSELFAVTVCIWIAVTFLFYLRALRDRDALEAALKGMALENVSTISLSKRLKNLETDVNRSLSSTEENEQTELRKNDLIMYLAHDLKTPLTSVIGYLTLLNDNPELSMEKKAEYTGIALNKAERLEELINEFFDITRLTLTKMTLQKEKRSLSRLLEQMVYENEPIIMEKGHTWVTEIEPDVIFMFDADKIERVIDNLIRNAMSYSFDNTPFSIRLKARNGSAVIVMENEGATIPRAKLDRLFEQFYRLDTARSSSTGNAGLGLAIAKEIVELHGGAITADSKNERIWFTVSLPLRS